MRQSTFRTHELVHMLHLLNQSALPVGTQSDNTHPLQEYCKFSTWHALEVTMEAAWYAVEMEVVMCCGEWMLRKLDVICDNMDAPENGCFPVARVDVLRNGCLLHCCSHNACDQHPLCSFHVHYFKVPDPDTAGRLWCNLSLCFFVIRRCRRQKIQREVRCLLVGNLTSTRPQKSR